MSPLLNGSPLHSYIGEPRFPCSASIGHTEVPFQGRRGQSQIRTQPYTPTRSRVCEKQKARVREGYAEMACIGCEIRLPMAGSGVLDA